MEEFDLEKYNTGGYDVVTRDGHNVRIICTDRKAECGYYIVALIEQEGTDSIMSYKLNGHYNYYDFDEHSDLMLVKKKWVPKRDERFYYITGSNPTVDSVIYSESYYQNKIINIGNCFRTKEEAEEKLPEILKVLKN